MARNIATIEDANLAIRDLQDQIKALTNPTIFDLHKKRAVNASPSKDANDYVIREELALLRNEMLAEIAKVKTSVNLLEKRVRALEP